MKRFLGHITSTYPMALVLASVLGLGACRSAPESDNSEAAGPAPIDVAAEFIQALRSQDVDAIKAMLAEFEGVPAGAYADEHRDLARAAEYFGSGKAFLIPIEGYVIGDYAVVAVDERSGSTPGRVRDLDPFYLIRQDGAWRVMPEPTSYDDWPVLSQEALEIYGQLKRWFDREDTRLRDKAAGVDFEPWQTGG